MFQEKLGSVLESTKPKIPHDAVCGVVHLLMLDSGFQPSSSPFPSSLSSSSSDSWFAMPADWRRSSQYLLQYSHPQARDATITLKCVPMQSLLLVHASFRSSSEILSLKIPVPDFVRLDRPLDSGPGIFQKLDQFIRLFRDSISVRLVSQIYEATGSFSRKSLPGLAPDVKLVIFSYLDAPSLCRVAQVSREFRRLAGDPFLWRQLAISHFHLPRDPINSQDWKALFARRYREEQERKRARLLPAGGPELPPPHRLIVPPPFYPAPNPGFPGIIGGDYDRFPGGLGGGIGGGFPNPLGPQPNLPYGGPIPPGARFDPFGPTPDINPFGGGNRGRGRGGGGNNPFGGGGFM